MYERREWWNRRWAWIFSEGTDRALKWVGLCSAGLLVLGGLFWVVQDGPEWQLRHEGVQVDPRSAAPSADEMAKLEDEYRKTILQALAGVLVLAGLWYTRRRILISEAGQITERYTRAIEQLGAVKACGDDKFTPNLEVRLGAIYALERIARDSERDHWPIMEVLTAYVCKNAPTPPFEPSAVFREDYDCFRDYEDERDIHPSAEIQAIVTVLGRRLRGWRREHAQRLDLNLADLRGADFSTLHFENADFSQSLLASARFYNANLSGARFLFSNLSGVLFMDANLDGAEFSGASDLWADRILKAKSWAGAEFDPGFREELEEAQREKNEKKKNS